MKAVSPTNSRPGKCERFRAAYFRAYPLCERCGEDDGTNSVHHIWGGPGRRDYRSNLVTLCHVCHVEMHQGPTRGRIECMARKWAKSLTAPREFVESDLNEVCSARFVRGWLEIDRVVYAARESARHETWRLLLLSKLEGE